MADAVRPKSPAFTEPNSPAIIEPKSPANKSNLVRKRGISKRKITMVFKRAESDKTDANISNSRKLILQILEDVKSLDNEINQLLSTEFTGDTVSDELDGELESQSNYILDVHNRLSALSADQSPSEEVESPRTGFAGCKLRLPDLKCDEFSGEGATNLQFHSFLSQFKNVVGNRSNLDKSTKLTYLKTFVKGYAAKIIQHLQICEENYEIALNLLKTEFLDEEALIDDLLAKLLKLTPKVDNTFLEMKIYLNDVRCILSDLNLYKKDFMSDNAGNLLLSHIVFSRLPVLFRQELVRKLGCKYPTLQQILDNYVEIVRLLNMRKPFSPPEQNKTNDKIDFQKRTVSRSITVDEKSAQFDDAGQKPRFCKLCSATGHSMLHCRRYDSFSTRKNRCVALKMCIRCSSTRHNEQECNANLTYPCLFCKSRAHISALCSKYAPQVVHNHCFNSSHDSNNNFLLPTVKVKLAVGNRVTTVRCLLDTGSQRSYFSSNVLRRLNINNETKTDLNVTTFLDNGSRSFSEIAATISVPSERDYVIPVLINENFDLKYCVDGMKTAHDNISRKYKLCDRANRDEVCLDGLLGVDSLQCFSTFELVSCLGGKAIKLASGVVPIGNVDSFLSEAQLEAKYRAFKSADESSVDMSVVNYVMNPIKVNCDPLDSLFDDSSIDGKMDTMFSLESMGIDDNEEEYCTDEVVKFEAGIQLIDGKYHVDLPWKENVTDVKSNFNISRAVVRKVVSNLHRDGLYDRYENVLQQQLEGDILEPISLDDIDVESHVWIPHRPVLKKDSATTKVRIVLNCSLKLGDTPSLNEAAFPGINLLNNLLDLLLKIRADRYLVMADIKSAYLMIKLKTDYDKNKFSILWIDRNGKLVAYRYKSIVFGYISSPFMLHYIIRHHLKNYPDDDCTDLIKNQMYVDNLFYTGRNVDCLRSTYLEACKRLAEGGFELREWASNCSDLSVQFEADNRSMIAPETTVKVLGYNYCATSDELRIADFDVKSALSVTKREVLSYVARVFDPLGFVLPVLVAAKIFLSRLWKQKLEWDEQLEPDLVEQWNRVKSSIDKVTTLTFNRSAYEGDEISLTLFCDSSKSAYGFCCYVKCASSVDSQLLFAKVKVAPKKSKTLPTLELLAAFMALKCLPSIIKSLKGRVTDVSVCIDAQVVLSWILTKNVKSKNVFARNRIADISKLRTEILELWGVDVKFRYVPTDINPSDLLTRGLTFDEFSNRLKFWKRGPEFLNEQIVDWPSEPLNCLSENSKLLTMNVVHDAKSNVIPVEKFSSLSKMIRVVTLVLKFISKLRKSQESELDLAQKARVRVFAIEQSKFFSQEREYLLGIGNRDHVPPLVKNLNLYIDDDGLIRSKGRLAQCDYFSEDIRNPVLLPRHSPVTGLVIADVHRRCMHMGVATTLAGVRKGGFWIPKGRAAVHGVLSRCIDCKKINAHPYKYPKPNDYVRDKVNFVTPFNSCGIDFTGHFWVRIDDVSRKMYLLVFTCLNIRAIHLELLPDMSCRSFLLAFIRFTNAHGMPSSIYSDNAQTFLTSMGIVENSSISDEFSNYLIENNVRHIRIPLYSAWVGAAWERMIRTVKSALYKVVGRKKMCYFELITVISDIVNVVNSRPLTYRGNDDDLEFITPNNFLKNDTGRSLLFGGVCGAELTVPNRRELVTALERRETMLERFKELWYDDYLLSLRETNRDLYQEEWQDRIQVDDVVMISAPNKPRPSWQMGRVCETLRGKDGKIRCVKVIRPDSSQGVYSISQLYPLELSVCPSSCVIEEPTDTIRPVRAAAVECRRRIRDRNC